MTIFTRLIHLVLAHGPAAIRKRGLESLFRITASAFGSPVPVNAGLSFEESLSEYARFTRRESDKLKALGTDTEGVRERLFRGGKCLGSRIRKAFVIREPEEAVTSMKALYAAIDIHTLGGESGGITVSRCYFSTTYTADTCSIISALDDGVFSGLSGGGRLIFNRRITEGAPSCECGIIPSKGDR